MKRFLKFVIISIVIVVTAFILVEISGKYKVSILRNNVTWSIDNKNCKQASDFDKDEDGNTYVAYKDSIKIMRGEGTEDILFQNDSLNIENILFYKGVIYYLSNDKIYRYDISKNESKVVLEGIPFKGKYLDRKLLIKDSKLLLAIGSATNSGVADNDGTFNINEIPYDTSPINITLTGNNYGEKKTGAFMAYGNSSLKGQKIECKKIANSSIIEIDPETNKVSLFACGIRNITGWSLDSDNNLICIIGGMEDSSDRPVKRDFDYLYKIEKNNWYGWPDFSGGDPIDSPRFKGDKPITKIIENHPNKIVQGPLFQFDELGSIKYLSIDTEGAIFEKDTGVYYDEGKNMISSITKDSVVNRLLKLKDDSIVKEIKIKDNSVYILDSGIGCIYKLSSNDGNNIFNLPRSVLIFIMVLLGILVFIFMYKYNSKNN
ncbi:hypothetical protein KDJ93_05405 [Clostridium butyricum]|uniref:hypothetical protein n=1 Tax=Clostridium butyricum TaxID=1492 RepID=UPI001BAB0B62|nr:hypothetical protein [Clostridium butyricum]QUF84340.1 hypothetical protein KDJ93_05405 [Clostridium butyricum]